MLVCVWQCLRLKQHIKTMFERTIISGKHLNSTTSNKNWNICAWTEMTQSDDSCHRTSAWELLRFRAFPRGRGPQIFWYQQLFGDVWIVGSFSLRVLAKLLDWYWSIRVLTQPWWRHSTLYKGVLAREDAVREKAKGATKASEACQAE